MPLRASNNADQEKRLSVLILKSVALASLADINNSAAVTAVDKARVTTPSTRVSRAGRPANSSLKGQGNDNTH